MSVEANENGTAASVAAAQYDVMIIGAGMSGMYQLHLLRKLGLSVRVFEAGTGVGGTWYWNRYPGARFDSESYSYGYSFSEELLDEWEWSEHFSAQPETLRYLNYVADKFDLNRDIQFGARVRAAIYDEAETCWELELESGERARARFLISAIGPLSAPTMPNIPGVESFQGEAFHTGLWPHEPVDFSGKRVAVIGTGATGVQTIQEVAKTVGHLTVFQRSPNYCAPLHNSPITAEEQPKIRAGYPETFARCRASHGGFIHKADHRNALEVSAEEREAFLEKLYSEPGFGIWMGNFRDMFTDEAANTAVSDFIKKKIRSRVNDPAIAEKLIPTDHGFGTRRVPLETRYYEVYNQDNVELVDLNEGAIEEITPKGLRTANGEYEFDMIIYATGFDAVTGAFDRIDIRGEGGRKLKDKWANGPRTYLGLQIEGFPNLLTLVGPHNAATFCNIPRCIEQNVEWVAELFGYIQANGITRIAATLEAEDAWTEHVYETAAELLFTKVDSWFMGINSNIPGKDRRTFLLYAGGAPAYRDRCDEVSANGYEGFALQKVAG
ncbi:MAG: NAD(P)/FAD-dependent oxidoreductase [Rhodospirillaceae bacterium]|jgi:cation diffusion facilitator CzcD-associated flavoprotein CzcO|nr:NAD(P)/FAD-dependent oxidoreductase [Rhodospirillaceae bacterium]MBT4687213.1 NAD(P)/FAD-dependent oxidoreductase [Rhodospirillaceae bacterium]MBT5082756.1 NAD(P)/FAD-dependent oxidoreductase [Rhodospirillaceae bacterium]MBT5524080.1 NAD(P)/FAD-dependent oxidoreductase [Rhodospirillaceae bacterium]MBT5880757.1 NAD(P)/FAD-dependent oxidoreductase [Rhodospirillaceae bacterium]